MQLRELLSRTLAGVPDESLIDRMNVHYPSEVTNAITQQDGALLKSVYNKAKSLPTSQTCAALIRVGVTISRICAGVEATVLFGMQKNSPVALKKVASPEEHERLTALAAAVLTHSSIVSFELLLDTVPRLPFMCMPQYVGTLIDVSPLDECRQLRLWECMHGALSYLHEKKFAHMDVKPENIALADNVYVLIDLSSTASFNRITEVTESFVPTDLRPIPFRGELPASALMDWWQLAVTFCWKLHTTCCGQDLSTVGVREVLKNNITGSEEKCFVYDELFAQIDSATATSSSSSSTA